MKYIDVVAALGLSWVGIVLLWLAALLIGELERRSRDYHLRRTWTMIVLAAVAGVLILAAGVHAFIIGDL